MMQFEMGNVITKGVFTLRVISVDAKTEMYTVQHLTPESPRYKEIEKIPVYYIDGSFERVYEE